jgi:hypothetical protein
MIGNDIMSIGTSGLVHGVLVLRLVRFVDRDMVMRYHWGLAVGHAYAHEKGDTDSMNRHVEECNREAPGIDPEVEEPDGLDLQQAGGQDDLAEHTLRNRDDDDWDNSDEGGGDDGTDRLGISDIEEDISEDELVFRDRSSP